MNFTERQAKSLVITATSVAAILAAVVDVTEGRAPNIRIGVGAVVAGGFMYAVAGFAPPLAGGLALVLIVGSALQNGPKVAEVLGVATGSTTKKKG